MSSPLIIINTTTSVEEATDIMIQNKIRHLLVVENDDRNKPLGIITATDFVAYLKENLNIDDVNAMIKLLKDQNNKENYQYVQKGGQEYENEEPRQGL